MPNRVCVVTNGTFPLKKFRGLYFYWVSIDGTEEVHDSIRGHGSFSKTKQNILNYISKECEGGKPSWKDIWITMTINSLNFYTVEEVVKEWHKKVNKIGFQFHTPFIKGDPLWLPYGKDRDIVIENILKLKQDYPKFVINDKNQLRLLKANWGGTGTKPIQCPTWAILSLDHMGRIKQPCCIGSADADKLKPICEDCGLGCYSILVAKGIKGN
jgi:hypothetical protein